jgi:hypothetical protein
MSALTPSATVIATARLSLGANTDQNALPEHVEAMTLALLPKSVMRLLFEAGPALS